jgi:hypothetical protein
VSRLQLPGRARTPGAAESAAFSAMVTEPKRIRAVARESARRDPYSGGKGAARREYGNDETPPAGWREVRRKTSGPLAAGAPVGISGPMAGGVAGRTSGALAEDATGGAPQPASERRGGGISLLAGERRSADNVTPAGGRCGGGCLRPSDDRVLQ